jgi:transcriptional regulator with XRE-family HTH domain
MKTKIGDKMKAIREGKSLSQKEIALAAGIDRAQYSRIESDKVEPSLSSLEKIAEALQVKVADFFSDEKALDINTFDLSLVEKVKMIDQLEDNYKKSILSMLELAITNQRLKSTLANALNM